MVLFIEPEYLVFPACAGMIPGIDTAISQIDGVPRMCGDDPVLIRLIPCHEVCSPRLWG